MENKSFIFTVISGRNQIPSSAHLTAFLIIDNWDDWFEFSTLYELIVIDETGARHDIGGVKIGQFQMAKRQRRPALPDEFDSLDESSFFNRPR